MKNSFACVYINALPDDQLCYEIDYGNLNSKTKANYEDTVGKYCIAGDSNNTLFD